MICVGRSKYNTSMFLADFPAMNMRIPGPKKHAIVRIEFT
jgi:hypothetical protein